MFKLFHDHWKDKKHKVHHHMWGAYVGRRVIGISRQRHRRRHKYFFINQSF